MPIIAWRAKPSSMGSVTATTCITPLSMSRCTRWRTAASERPTTLPIAAYERRPSCCSSSMIALETSSSTIAGRGRPREDPLRVGRVVTGEIVARGVGVVKDFGHAEQRISLQGCFGATDSLVCGARVCQNPLTLLVAPPMRGHGLMPRPAPGPDDLRHLLAAAPSVSRRGFLRGAGLAGLGLGAPALLSACG